jgi:hypothetical protein
LDATIVIRERLTLMANAGATLRELVAQLDRQKPLPGSEYETLWLYCWALVRRRPSPLLSDSEPRYGEIGPG